ncbi:MAG: RNA 2'-phosphotransferase [Thermoplasmata archaeon]|nr:MAG: RNA 2'-phosphotransferase [Thermoplasmata archaeon]
MLGECNEHGYYRGEKCPICGEEGKFVMNDWEVRKLSGTMIGILRHFPEQFDVEMDEKGWVEMGAMADAIKRRRADFHWLRIKHIKAIAETDEKGRYQVEGKKIRATYAHTIDIDLSDLPPADTNVLFYPVTEEEVDIVLEQGLFPIDRNKVHLSGSVEKALEAGRIRTENPVILRIDAAKAMEDGVIILKAGKDVYIADEIDAKYLSRYE